MSRTLDLTRILAALTIFYYHVSLNLRLPLGDKGEYAVTTFLLLAIATAVAFSLPRDGGSLRAGPYLKARLIRLLPLYLCVNLGIYGLSFFLPSQLGRPFTATELLWSCLGISQYVGTRYLSLVFWFIPFIIQVYVLVAFGHRFIERLRGWWWLPVAFALFWVEIQLLARVSAQPTLVVRDWSPLFRPAELLLGVQGGLWLTHRLSDRAFVGRMTLYAGLSGLFALGARQAPSLAYVYFLPWYGLLVTVALCAAGALAAWALRRTPARPWRVLGQATYPFYLIHGLAIMTLFHRFGSRPAVWVGYALFCLAAALGLNAIFSLPKRRAAV